MTNIKLTVTGAQARASVTGPLTSGMVGLPVAIEYDEAWDALTKNLICRCSPWGSIDGENRAILNVGETASVAHEVMLPDRYLYLGLEGFREDGTLVMPTTWACCGKIVHGANTCEDPSTAPSLSVWNQLQVEMEQLQEQALTQEQAAELQACALEARQAAEEAKEAAASVGDGLYYTPIVTQPTDNTLEFRFQPSVSGASVPNPVVVDLPTGGAGGQNAGISADARNLLITILRNASYDTDQSANITALEAALAAGGDDSGEDSPDAVTYTITNNLDNVTNSNRATSVAQNATYSATLTAEEGYVLGSVVVTMGSVDITASAYINGYITIANVTGDVVITATATATTVQTEELTEIVHITAWPVPNEDGEWGYTERTTAGQYVAFLPGELYGGKLRIAYNVEEFPGFDISVRTSTADGKAAHCSSGSVPDVTWVVAGQTAVTGKATESPITYDIPDGEKPMVILRRGNNETTEIYSNALFCEWVKGGGVSCTVTVGEEV